MLPGKVNAQDAKWGNTFGLLPPDRLRGPRPRRFDSTQPPLIVCATLPAGLEAARYKHDPDTMKTAIMAPATYLIVSPLLLNIALHGMESAAGVSYRRHRDSYEIKGSTKKSGAIAELGG